MTAGAATRATILHRTAMLASVEGLEGVSLGRVAGAVGMSKSGLFAHFKSKEQLQLATIEEASRIYSEEVARPALAAPPGLPRLRAYCESFLSYVERGVFPGGCFFAAAMAEYGSRPGPVRDRIAQVQRWWLSTLEAAAREAIRAGELDGSADPAHLAFELESVMVTANWYAHLFDDPAFLGRARQSVARLLEAAAGPS